MIIYNLLIRLYALLIRIASLRQLKAQQWVRGRKNWRGNLEVKLKAMSASKKVWVHCASYGEFEQGRPIIEAIGKKHPDHKIILTFFSPSGYEAFKDWTGADLICYLPLDTKTNAKDFIELVNPKVVIFIKYEFWLNFLFRLKKQSIPTYLVSAVFKPHHPFFRWYGSIFRRSLNTFEELFIQDENSGKLLEDIGIKNYEICGDTRFDRVLEIKKEFKTIPYFETYCGSAPVLIAGSTWPKDEELLIESFLKSKIPDFKLILVPHSVDEKSISNVRSLLEKNELTYSLYSEQKPELKTNVLIVDAMGLLSKIYHYASVAYIGGGFNSGIHNILEPAVYLKPVMFYGGDDYHKFNEAIDLLNMGAAINVADTVQLQNALNVWISNKNETKEIESKLHAYFQKNSGTTERVLNFIKW